MIFVDSKSISQSEGVREAAEVGLGRLEDGRGGRGLVMFRDSSILPSVSTGPFPSLPVSFRSRSMAGVGAVFAQCIRDVLFETGGGALCNKLSINGPARKYDGGDRCTSPDSARSAGEGAWRVTCAFVVGHRDWAGVDGFGKLWRGGCRKSSVSRCLPLSTIVDDELDT